MSDGGRARARGERQNMAGHDDEPGRVEGWSLARTEKWTLGQTAEPVPTRTKTAEWRAGVDGLS